MQFYYELSLKLEPKKIGKLSKGFLKMLNSQGMALIAMGMPSSLWEQLT